MGVEFKVDMGKIEKYIDEKTDVDGAVQSAFIDLARECVDLAKNLDTYKDRTMNLRNSIGFVLAKRGEIIKTEFEVVGRGTEYPDKRGYEDGEIVGERVATDIANETDNEYVLVVVAGMHYASYVEDIHHLAVLEPAKNRAKNRFGNLPKQIINNMKSMN